MEFITLSKEKCPVRLSEPTRKFAYDSLAHVYGLDTKKTPAVTLDDIPGFAELPAIKRYDTAIRRIAEEAPIRICDGELVSGAATLGKAISHCVPADFDGKAIFTSISHLTVDFPDVLRRGVSALYADIEKSMSGRTDPREISFLESDLSCLDSFRIWHKRYLDELEKRGMTANLKLLERVPFEPAHSFREAVQSLWFTFAFIRLCGNWTAIGRIDQMLGGYLKRDLEAGAETLDSAREFLAHFFIKGCEWICGGNYGSGDAQHYQNIVLAGIDSDGNEVTNEVTYLVLDIIEELGISDFPITIRLSRNSPELLLTRAAEVMRHGGGVIALYNEELIIDSLTNFGYPLTEARSFANDGCWEVQIPGKTYFIYNPFDSLAVLQKKTLNSYENVDFGSFDELYAAYISDLDDTVGQIFGLIADRFDGDVWKPLTPCTVVSLFERGCIENARSYLEGGPVYNMISPHIGGFPDTVNSLYAIKKLVFDEKLVGFREFMSILKNDWKDAEALRLRALNRLTYYGNDSDEVDFIAVRLLGDFASMCEKRDKKCAYRFPGGVSTFGRQLEWAQRRLATPYGRRAGEILAPNMSPTPGTDREGATAIIRSYCKPDLKRIPTGAALDLKLLPTSVEGEDGLGALKGLMRGFVELGGFFMQPDVADAAILREAQEHPGNYQTLSVRVSGWNARFVTLAREWQDMVIGEVES